MLLKLKIKYITNDTNEYILNRISGLFLYSKYSYLMKNEKEKV